MAKKQTPKRTIVGSPLTPELLKELGAIDELPQSPEHFDPHGNFTNTYRIWTCHGFRESGNQNVGFLRIERLADKSNATHMLKIHQEVAETDGILNVIDAEIKCVTSRLGCPVEWHVSSQFIDTDGKAIEQLRAEEKGSKKKGIMTVKTGGRTLFTRKEVPWLTCDWCIFEFIQRLQFEEQGWLPFDMLEGLTVMKENQCLSYRGLNSTKMDAELISLHCFVQTGSGILPYEYWLDNNHRLMAVTSMNKAYILDDQAVKTIKQKIEQLRKSYMRTKSAIRK